jgi:hypothetical protein
MATIKLDPVKLHTLRLATAEITGIDPTQPFFIKGILRPANLERQWNARGVCKHDEPYHNLDTRTPEFKDLLATARLICRDIP